MAGLSLSEFWDSTPYELGIVLRGFSQRVERWYEVGAFVAAHIMNMWTKKRITPKRLLPKKAGVVDAAGFASADDFRAYIERKRAERES